MSTLSPTALARLEREQTIWLASVRPDGRPHLVPLWFVWEAGAIFLCVQPDSVKVRNIAQNARVALALESGGTPLIVEGEAALLPAPWPAGVVAAFQRKYNWDISSDSDYGTLIAVIPRKWMIWES